MDDVDVTTEREAKMMEILRRRIIGPEIDPSGFCHFCEEPIDHPKKFCDRDCADDYEKEKKMNKFRGTQDEN